MKPSNDEFIRQKAEEGYALTDNDMEQPIQDPIT